MATAEEHHERVLAALPRVAPAAPLSVGPLRPEAARAVFRAMCLSRALDLNARAMQARGEGFYTIGSSGHEGMAAVALALRHDDMAFLHYRDGAFQLARATQAGLPDPVTDMILSFACSADDPISGGRHKVLGSRRLMIPPQTSTIASHLPKAVGAAYSIGLMRRHRPEHAVLAQDGVVMASFGDASVNHASAQAAFNAAGWAGWSGAALPLLFVCEDNGIGISTPSPEGWVAAVLQARPGVTYFAGDGCDPYDAHRAAVEAVAFVRARRRPAVLHLSMVRLFGHAGADLQEAYRARAAIAAEEARDPILTAAARMAAAGAMTPAEAHRLYAAAHDEVRAKTPAAVARPPLRDSAEVMATIIPPTRTHAPTNGPAPDARAAAFGPDLKATEDPQPMARQIGWALTDLMLAHPEITVMGEDVGRKGGVYGATRGLHARFGAARVIDTLLDETSILGLGLGLAQNGFLPVPEIQFLAYLHNAEDQLRGEGATLPFFSKGQFTNPMVLRIAGLGYQKGFGGHFHNDNSLAVLRDIPGLILACPSRGDEAAMLLREAVRLARDEQRLVVFLEPIALYPARDLHGPGDGGWLTRYPAPDRRLPFGEVGVAGDGTDLAIVTYGNGRILAEQARPAIEAAGLGLRVIDLRWLVPLPVASLARAAAGVRRILVVDECRAGGNVAEGLMTWAVEARRGGDIARLSAADSFIATGPAAAATLPSAAEIVAAALALASRH